jgi:hypothetical protein
MLPSHDTLAFTECAYSHVELRKLAATTDLEDGTFACNQARNEMYSRGRICNRHCLLFRQNLAVGHYRQYQYLGSMGRSSSHRLSGVVVRWLPGARALYSPVVVYDERRRSSPYWV